MSGRSIDIVAARAAIGGASAVLAADAEAVGVRDGADAEDYPAAANKALELILADLLERGSAPPSPGSGSPGALPAGESTQTQGQGSRRSNPERSQRTTSPPNQWKSGSPGARFDDATMADLTAASELLDSALPVVFDVLDIDAASRPRIAALLRSGMACQEGAVRQRPQGPPMTVRRLAQEAHISRASIYSRLAELGTQVQHCALALTMLLAARGDLREASTWMICEIDSLVGRRASGPGTVASGGRLLGVALVGRDVTLPVMLVTPPPAMTQLEFAEELNRMLSEIAFVASRLRTSYATARLQTLGLSAHDLLVYMPTTTVLVPELYVHRGRDDRRVDPLVLPGEAARRLAPDHGFAHGMVEINDNPQIKPEEWVRLVPETRSGLLPFDAGTDFHMSPHLASVSYYLRRDGSVLHRRQRSALIDPVQGVRTDVSFALSGFNARDIYSMSSAIGYAELLAAKTEVRRCNDRFADQLRPGLVKAQGADQRTLLHALQMTCNMALVAVGRDRAIHRADEENPFSFRP